MQVAQTPVVVVSRRRAGRIEIDLQELDAAVKCEKFQSIATAPISSVSISISSIRIAGFPFNHYPRPPNEWE
jgi:hypothetical protein